MDDTLSFRPIFKRVLLYHLLFVILLYLMPSSGPAKTERVRVQTVKLAPKGSQTASNAPTKKQEAPKVESAPKKKETPKKKESAAKKKEAPKRVEKAAQTKKGPDRKELIKKVQESVAKMESMEATSATSGALGLKPIESLSFQGGGGIEEGYISDLTASLKLLLHLPEYGQVRLYLTVLRSGDVDSFEIVESASRINRTYLERALRELALPAFGSRFPQEEKHTFALTLSNELH